MNVYETMKKYYETELASTERFIKKAKVGPITDKVIDGTIAEFLGIAQFAQLLGVPFELTDELYTEYRTKLENLAKDN